MKAAVIEAIGQPLVVKEVPIPEPGPGEILVKIEASGVCNGDIDAHAGDFPTPALPQLPRIPATGAPAQSKRLARMSAALRSATGSGFRLCTARAGTVNTVLTASICCAALSC